MTRSREKYLSDMLDACRFLIEFTVGENMERYIRDRVFRRVVERELTIIGEAMMQLKRIDPSTAERIDDHERIIRFRHVLVHGYHIIEPDIVWHVVTDGLPALRRDLEAIMGPMLD